jgi:hypothetical protein
MPALFYTQLLPLPCSNTTQPCTELFCPIYSLAATPDPLLSAAGNESDSQIYMAVGLDSGKFIHLQQLL